MPKGFSVQSFDVKLETCKSRGMLARERFSGL